MGNRLRSWGALGWLGANAAYVMLAARRRGAAKRIPESPLSGAPERLIRLRAFDANPIPHVPVPQHPFMAPNPGSNMHCDAYISDTYEASGPLGIDHEVITRTEGFGGYGTITFDSHGRIVAVYSNGRAFRLELLDPFSLDKLAAHDLPARPLGSILRGPKPWEYLGAGMYFYLDHLDRAVVPTTRGTVQVVQAPAPGSGAGFELVAEHDLAGHMVPGVEEDTPAFCLPEWGTERYWFASTYGMVGTLDPATGTVRTMRLDGELVENSFAVGEEGVFIISDMAMYRFEAGADGEPVVVWRSEYEKAAHKAGHISVGSGTSVSLTGDPETGMVVIADNAEPRINALFMRRADGALVGGHPLWQPGRSGTDLTAIAFEHADAAGKGTGVHTAILENNWGPSTFPISRPEPGLTRVDLIPRGDGTHECREVWASRERSIGGFRLSLGNGLVYIYGWEGSWLRPRWYLIAIDFATGETVYKALTGTGMGFNNWSGSLFLHPQGGIAYSTTIFGAVMVRDRAVRDLGSP